ncbi:MAG: hypothetical protein JSW39_01080 [Desulfobacterales bacterium]|nr:MAG: hypothetical protein JSW39_01080 [Desulfobacterales bacterium]
MRYMFRCGVFTIGVVLCLTCGPPGAFAAEFSPHKAEFTVQVNNIVIPYKLMSVFVMPGEILRLWVATSHESDCVNLRAYDGQMIADSQNQWHWRAPKLPGIYPLSLEKGKSADSMTLNVFVMRPSNHSKGEYLNGYRIGKYPQILLKNLPIYKPPPGFIEVTPQNSEVRVSPHFKLRQFLCKQENGYPQYLVLKERLLLKLELILAKVNEKGYRCDTLHIMSGYRTPYYNQTIGNVKYSRHLYGGAADIFIDENPPDAMMDDLNHDGKINFKDAAILYDVVDEMYGKKFYARLAGGLGRYRKTHAHGPFVHVDVRGFRARWGD